MCGCCLGIVYEIYKIKYAYKIFPKFFPDIFLRCHKFVTCPIQLSMKFWERLPAWIAKCVNISGVREIRLRNNAPIRVNVKGQWYFCCEQGLCIDGSQCKILDVCCDDIVRMACNNSIFAYEQMLAEGYFTLDDGSRFGVAGSYSSAGQVFVEYTSICIRLPHCIDCANAHIMSTVRKGNTLIVGAPASGKTTLLRDVASKISKVENVVVLDERGELDVCCVLQNCDVLKWTSKPVGVEMALRCLSPQYVFCDELSQADLAWISRATSAGVKVIATLHAGCFDEVKRSGNWLDSFSNVIFCSGVGKYNVRNLAQ